MVKRAMVSPFHPFLVCVYPILALLASNETQSSPLDALRSIVVSAMMTVVLLALAKLVLRDWHRAALLCSFILLLFFTYGHVYRLVEDMHFLGFNIGRHRFLIVSWLAILVGGSILIARVRQSAAALTQSLNVFAAVAVILPLAQFGYFSAGKAVGASASRGSDSTSAGSDVPRLQAAGDQAPDIYYIILDMYTRDDILRTSLHYDNSAFEKGLADLGFYVAECSRSNYNNTTLSLSSSLNLDYLEKVAPSLLEAQANPAGLDDYILHNKVRFGLAKAGYTIVGFDSGFSPTRWEDANVYLSDRSGPAVEALAIGGLNGFESTLMRTSAGLLLYEAEPHLPKALWPYLDSAYQEHRARILFSLDHMTTVSDLPGPKFVFIHILAPHPPFVFGPDGEFVVRNTPFALNFDVEYAVWTDFVRGYTSELHYLNQRVLQGVASILKSSVRPVVIVIQGDHGIPRFEAEKANFSILNAYRLPGNGRSRLYSSISPVNTFRVIFDEYLGGSYPLLDDVSYFGRDTQHLFSTPVPVPAPSCAMQ